jgi:STE24 endopeptidase
MGATGSYWWLYAFAFLATVQLLLMYLYPVFIAPLFNTFTPLEEGSLKDQIFSLAEKIGFKTSGIFIMDGSKRSSHGNAYFTGFGAIKRIVLFDTLIENLSEPQAISVLAHEMGHERKGHIKKTLVISLITTCLGFWVLSLFINYQPFYQAFGFPTKSYHAALVIFAFASSPITYFLSPLFSLLSRKHEYEADRFAIDAVGGCDDLCEALLSLSKNSLSNLTPHPWYSFFHYSHPTLTERLQAMRVYAAG